MATEIELKARIHDYEQLMRLLSEKADYICSIEKEDVYWIMDSCAPIMRLRLRKERCEFPDRNSESLCFVTHKNKILRDGIEVNDEREFEVKPVEEFEYLLGKIGLKPGASKQKRGWRFHRDGLNAELCEVEKLGWFLELEIIAEDSQEKTFAECKKRLLDFLDSLGIEREAIESRFYSEMLGFPLGS
jgi:adenylate cyclase class 2